MVNRFLFDTSAFIAFLQAEPGAPRIRDLLEQSARRESDVIGCFVSLTEVQYITHYDFGEEAARATIADMKRLPVIWLHTDDALCSTAADIKASHRVSLADAFVVASALRLDALLVHKDPEFAALPGPLKQEMLPAKTGRT